jgi:hypothetical protein
MRRGGEPISNPASHSYATQQKKSRKGKEDEEDKDEEDSQVTASPNSICTQNLNL